MPKKAAVEVQERDPNAYDQKPVAQLVIAWSVVGIPLAWAVYETLLRALALFR